MAVFECLKGEKPQNRGRIVTFLLSIFDNLLCFSIIFWIGRGRFLREERREADGDIGTVQLYWVVMEESKIDRLYLDWEIEIFVEGLRFLLRDFGIFLGWDLDWGIFGGRGKSSFSPQKIEDFQKFQKKICNQIILFHFYFHIACYIFTADEKVARFVITF